VTGALPPAPPLPPAPLLEELLLAAPPAPPAPELLDALLLAPPVPELLDAVLELLLTTVLAPLLELLVAVLLDPPAPWFTAFNASLPQAAETAATIRAARGRSEAAGVGCAGEAMGAPFPIRFPGS
jgi:hypothetical protein